MAVVEDNKSTRIISLLATTGTQIIAHGYHKRILVQENYTSATGATTDLAKQAPIGADNVIVPMGTPAIFTAHGPNGSFYPGEVVGLVTVLDVAGPVEGAQTEDDEI